MMKSGIVRMNLLDGPKLLMARKGASWGAFVVGILLALLGVLMPLGYLSYQNVLAAHELDSLRKEYEATYKNREQVFAKLVSEKAKIQSALQKVAQDVKGDYKLSDYLDEIRKRMPQGVKVTDRISLKVDTKNRTVISSLQLVADSYLNAVAFMRSFADSPLILKSVEIIPVAVPVVSQNDKLWRFTVKLVFQLGGGEAR